MPPVILAETEYTLVGLLVAGITCLAGVIARLYVVQERHARRAADAYSRLAVYLLETGQRHCDQDDCPLRRAHDLPEPIRQLVAGAAAIEPDEPNPGDRRR